MYYVNHTSPYYIYVDSGLTGSVQSTGITVYSSLITDVSATVLNGQVLLSYIASNGVLSFATSANGVNFSAPIVPSAANLGILSGYSATNYFPAALTSTGTTAYVATASHQGCVSMSKTTNGTSFTPLYTGCAWGPWQRGWASKPSLTMFNGAPWLAQTGWDLNGPVNSSPYYAVVGNALTKSFTEIYNGMFQFGNSHTSGIYAGVDLVYYSGYLYLFYQSAASSQDLNYLASPDGVSGWYTNHLAGNQMRWTPSLAVVPSGSLFLTYQDDANTNISFRHN